MSTMSFINWANPTAKATMISERYDKYQSYRTMNRDKWTEMEGYLFATDTTTLKGGDQFDHTTHIPVIAQIKEELEAILYSTILPHEDFLSWRPYDSEAESLSVRRAVTAYVHNRHTMNGFEKTFRKLIQDLVMYGNSFCQVVYADERDSEGHGYVGPKPKRISPYDIVFDPFVEDFVKSPKIIQKLMTMGEFLKWATRQDGFDREVIDQVKKRRSSFASLSKTEINKNQQFLPDGFTDIQAYYQSGMVEVLLYYGDVYNEETEEVEESRYLAVVDRVGLLADEEERNPNIYKGSWSEKPDNLWSQGPLDKIVGINFQINHRENSKSDALDRFIHPDRVFMGDVEVVYNEETGSIDYLAPEGGGVRDLVPDTTVLTADMHQDRLMNHARLAAGLPPQLLGFRTPGEKTAEEVSRLDDAALRKFLHKAAQFEMDLLEQVVRSEVLIGRDNFHSIIQASVLDETGIPILVEISEDDLKANGKLVPIGARRFARQTQQLAMLNSLGNSNLGQLIGMHIDTFQLARAVENVGGFNKFEFVDRFAQIREQGEAQMEQAMNEQELTQNLSNPGLYEQ